MSTFVPRRRNGLTPPYSRAQMSAWVALVATAIQFPLFCSPVMPLAASVPMTLVFFSFVTGTIYYGTLALGVDPMDPHLAQHLKEEEQNANGAGAADADTQEASNKDSTKGLGAVHAYCNPVRQGPLPDEPMKQCWICDTQVAEHSMHCKFCNKCVYHFDHHCMWLNTCVGAHNYRYFFRTMLFIFAMELSHFVIQLVLLIDIFTQGPTKDRANDWFGEEAIEAIYIGFLLFNAISILLIGQLLWFHVGLQKEGLTTYQFIVRDHQRKRDKSKVEAEILHSRMVETQKAKQQGQNWHAFRLQMGDHCRQIGCSACDPLDVSEFATVEPDPEAGFAASLGAPRSHDAAHNDDLDIIPIPADSPMSENGNGVSFISVKDKEEQKESENGLPKENGNGVHRHHHADEEESKETEPEEADDESKTDTAEQ